jgi:uncharacterized protein
VIRVTLDTNEYVSALTGGSRGLRLLHLAIDGDIEIAISEPIIAETIRVLREKFEWPPYDLHDARQRLERIGRKVAPKMTLAVVADEPDNRILEAHRKPVRNTSSPRTERFFGSRSMQGRSW